MVQPSVLCSIREETGVEHDTIAAQLVADNPASP